VEWALTPLYAPAPRARHSPPHPQILDPPTESMELLKKEEMNLVEPLLGLNKVEKGFLKD